MRYLLDTNVLSEHFKVRPNPIVASWVDGMEPASLYVSVLSLGEMRKGVDAMAESGRKTRILRFLDQGHAEWFEGRILAVDLRVADVWGALEARTPRTLPTIDALLAATAIVHDMALVTRNKRDFDLPGLRVIDPWTEGPDGAGPSTHTGETAVRYRARRKIVRS